MFSELPSPYCIPFYFRRDWLFVNVNVSPAAVKVTDINDESDVKLDTRLRFLCYFGISAHDVRYVNVDLDISFPTSRF